MHYSFFRYSAL